MLKQFVHYVQTQFGTTIKTLGSDNAKELALTVLQQTCILYQFSCPYRPYQNSVVERKHQHLVNVARSLMYQASIPIQYWGLCVSTAAFLINRTPSKNLKHLTPYELQYKEPPIYATLRTFSCLSYVTTLPSTRTKFTRIATPCIFMGYSMGYKGYRVFDPAKNKFLITKDIIFHETVFSFKSLPQTDNYTPLADVVIP